MECRDVRELADSFLSEQLLVETNHELLRHLDTCPNCRADLAARRALRDGLRRAFSHAEDLRPRPELAAELLATLRPSLPEIPSLAEIPSQPEKEISRRSVLQSWWALAAGLVLAAGGGLVVRNSTNRSRLGALAREAAGDHQNCAVKFTLAERPIELEEAGRRYGAPYAALATFEPPAVDGSLEMLERHSCVYQGRRYGHVVFRYRGALTSLLVTNGTPPATPQLEPIDAGPAVASLPAGRFLGFIVADLDRPSVLRLAQTLTEPLSQRLA
jgi:anti-sigma factor RsiW